MEIIKIEIIKGYAIEFYRLEGESKLRFRVQDNEKLTQALLAHCTSKTVKEDKMRFAINGLRDKIEQGILDPANFQTVKPQVLSEDYCTRLNLYVQKQWRESVVFETIPKGYETLVELTMPDGRYFSATATNKKLAKQLLCEKACNLYGI